MDGNKKLIIPVVTLVLCMLVAVGVGYGLTANTTVTDQENGISADQIVVDLSDKNGEVTDQMFNSGAIDYTTYITYNSGAATTTYKIAAGQIVTLNDDGIQLTATLPDGVTAGDLTVTITGADAAFTEYFSSVSVTVGSQPAVVDENLSDGLTFTVSGWDGTPSDVTITGTTLAWDSEINGTTPSTAPAFDGTFDVMFDLSVEI